MQIFDKIHSFFVTKFTIFSMIEGIVRRSLDEIRDAILRPVDEIYVSFHDSFMQFLTFSLQSFDEICNCILRLFDRIRD